MQIGSKEIIKEIAREEGIPYDVAKKAVESQFECARQKLQEGVRGDKESFNNVRFKYLGLILASKRAGEEINSQND